MKLKFGSILALIFILLVGGCGNFGKNANKPNREEATIIHEKEKEGGSLETGAGYGFTKFDLEIDVDGQDVIDVDYEATENVMADYEDKLKSINLKGQKAFDEVNNFFLHILITKDTSREDVIKKITEWFEIDTYSKFDLEVHFDDGTRLDIKDNK